MPWNTAPWTPEVRARMDLVRYVRRRVGGWRSAPGSGVPSRVCRRPRAAVSRAWPRASGLRGSSRATPRPPRTSRRRHSSPPCATSTASTVAARCARGCTGSSSTARSTGRGRASCAPRWSSATTLPLRRLPSRTASAFARIGELPPEHRAVVVLRYVLEYTPGEIAELLDLPRGTVNSRLRRGLDRMKDVTPEERGGLGGRPARVRRAPAGGGARVPAGTAAAAVAVAAVVGAALSPPGRAVFDRVRKAVGIEHAEPALFSLPAAGTAARRVGRQRRRLARESDGFMRKLGPYSDAEWSPHGLYVIATEPNELVAIDPDKGVRWRLARPPRPGRGGKGRRPTPGSRTSQPPGFASSPATGRTIISSCACRGRPTGLGSHEAPHDRVLQRRRDRPPPLARPARVAHADQGHPLESRVVVRRPLSRRRLAEAGRRDRPPWPGAAHDLDARGGAATGDLQARHPRRRGRRSRSRAQRGSHRRRRPSGARAPPLRRAGQRSATSSGRRPGRGSSSTGRTRINGCSSTGSRCARSANIRQSSRAPTVSARPRAERPLVLLQVIESRTCCRQAIASRTQRSTSGPVSP